MEGILTTIPHYFLREAVAKSTPKRLKVYPEQSPEVHCPEIEGVESLAGVCQAVRACDWLVAPLMSLGLLVRPGTGLALVGANRSGIWERRRTPQARGEPFTGRRAERGAIAEDSVKQLASAVAGVAGRVVAHATCMWKREAELAAGVPLGSPASDEASHFGRTAGSGP